MSVAVMVAAGSPGAGATADCCTAGELQAARIDATTNGEILIQTSRAFGASTRSSSCGDLYLRTSGDGVNLANMNARVELLHPRDLAELGGLEFVAREVVEGFLTGLHRS